MDTIKTTTHSAQQQKAGGHSMTPSLDLVLFCTYRYQVRRTSSDARSFRDRLTYGTQGMIGEIGEIGELVELVKKRNHPDFHPMSPPVTPTAILNEACDVLWYATYLLNLFDIASTRINWPERDMGLSDDTDCSLMLGIEAGGIAWLTRQHRTHRMHLHYSQLEAAILRHCGSILYMVTWLLDCYGLTLQDAMQASVVKSHTRFPDEHEVSA